MNKRLGFFGGCFNPPTIAHIALIKTAIERAKLDKVYFVPMGNFYEKENLIEFKHRINMLKLAIKNNPKMEILEILPNRKTYAIDAFRLINERFSESENFFIMGSDNFQKLETWKDSEELLKNYKYIILDRDSLNRDDLIIIKGSEALKKISSSMIRKKIKNNEKIDDFVIKHVEDYILENELYK